MSQGLSLVALLALISRALEFTMASHPMPSCHFRISENQVLGFAFRPSINCMVLAIKQAPESPQILGVQVFLVVDTTLDKIPTDIFSKRSQWQSFLLLEIPVEMGMERKQLPWKELPRMSSP
jgi:hypothetical protein